MTIRSGFFNSSAGDRVYDASFMAEVISLVNGNGVQQDTQFAQSNTGLDLNTTIGPGNALINGYYVSSDANEVLTHAGADPSNDRIDRIILRLDLNASQRAIQLLIKDGVASSQPVPPDLTRTALVWELSLAQVRVPANSASIPTNNITSEITDTAVCGIITYQGFVDPLTATEVKILYESNADTNAFTDADEIKLDGIEDRTTTGEANKILKLTSDQDIVGGRYLKLGSNYIRFNNNVLEASSDGITWQGVGAVTYNKFDVITARVSNLTTTAVTVASFTGSGIIREIIVTNNDDSNDRYNVFYSIDGQLEQQVTRPEISSFSLGKSLGGIFTGEKSYDLPVNLTFNTSFTIRVSAVSGTVDDMQTAVKFNFE